MWLTSKIGLCYGLENRLLLRAMRGAGFVLCCLLSSELHCHHRFRALGREAFLLLVDTPMVACCNILRISPALLPSLRPYFIPAGFLTITVYSLRLPSLRMIRYQLKKNHNKTYRTPGYLALPIPTNTPPVEGNKWGAGGRKEEPQTGRVDQPGDYLNLQTFSARALIRVRLAWYFSPTREV